MDFDAEDVEELDAALVGVSWSDIHLLKCNLLVERRVSTNPSGRAAMGMKRTPGRAVSRRADPGRCDAGDGRMTGPTDKG